MNEKIKVTLNFSWFVPWLAGFLFTFGLVGPDPLLATYPWWQQAGLWILSWCLWPYALGCYLRGGL